MGQPSRGYAMSAYLPPFNPATSAKIYGNNIQSGVITSAHIADGTIVAADVAAGSITSAKLGAAAVTSAKLGAAAVTSAKINTSAIVHNNLKFQVITSAVANSGVVYSLAHTLGKVPTIKIFSLRGTAAELVPSSTSAATIGEASVSAATSAVVYYAGAKNTRFTVFLMV